MHPFSALGTQNQTTQATEPHEENKQAIMDLFHPPAAYLDEGGQEAEYRQRVLGIVSGVDLDECTTEDEEASQEEL